MAVYYNEWDKATAQWLRNLMTQGLIPDGVVDDRSITDVDPEDLKEFTQCHFFAGVAGWSRALRLVGWPDDRPVWTGSPPCQPYSVAGRLLGPDDPRHLSPVFLRLVRECRPPVLFGEQVANAISKHWLDHLCLNLEEKGYAIGAAVLPAAGVGAPHKRDRIFFGAYLLGDNAGQQWERCRDLGTAGRIEPSDDGNSGRVADDLGLGPLGRRVVEDSDAEDNGGQTTLGRLDTVESEGLCGTGGMVDSDSERLQGIGSDSHPEGQKGQDLRPAGLLSGAGDNFLPRTYSDNGFWSGADWIGCKDSRFRAVEPGTQPLANGVPGRVVRLRAYGNAIVPPLAAEFIIASAQAVLDMHRIRGSDLEEDLIG